MAVVLGSVTTANVCGEPTVGFSLLLVLHCASLIRIAECRSALVSHYPVFRLLSLWPNHVGMNVLAGSVPKIGLSAEPTENRLRQAREEGRRMDFSGS